MDSDSQRQNMDGIACLTAKYDAPVVESLLLKAVDTRKLPLLVRLGGEFGYTDTPCYGGDIEVVVLATMYSKAWRRFSKPLNTRMI